MDEDQAPVDFSPLDPARDSARWESVLQSVAARAHARRRASLSRDLVRRGVPAFVLAAAAAASVWLAAPARPAPPPATEARAPADVVAGWALGDAIDPRELVTSEVPHERR